MSRILVVEDEQHLADGLRFNLEAEGHQATVASDGEQALTRLLVDGERFDALVLDVMLPGKDGFTVAAELRAAGKYMPILMLTARGRAEDVLKGFEAGADDYLAKPFELSILLARLSGLLRRSRWNEQDPVADAAAGDVYAFAGRTIDFGAMLLHSQGESHPLTLMECELLRYLVQNAGQVIAKCIMCASEGQMIPWNGGRAELSSFETLVIAAKLAPNWGRCVRHDHRRRSWI